MTKLEEAYEKGYDINEQGQVIGPHGLILDGYNARGYMQYNFRDSRGINSKFMGHRLQGLKKFGDKIFEKNAVIVFADRNTLNCSYDNILLSDRSGVNFRKDKEVRVRSAKTAASHNLKFEHKDVFNFYQEHKSYKKTMEEFGIKSKSTLNNIIKKMSAELESE